MQKRNFNHGYKNVRLGKKVKGSLLEVSKTDEEKERERNARAPRNISAFFHSLPISYV